MNIMRKIFLLLTGILITFTMATPSYAIKIGLCLNQPSVQVSASEEAQMIDVKTNKQVCVIHKMLMYEITPLDSDKMIVRSNWGQCTVYTNNAVIKPYNTSACVFAKGNWYRGILRVENRNNTIAIINDVCLENYLQSVVPSEMPPTWETEALKAQAIAARTYAIANMGKHGKDGFDLVDTQMDQVYNGVKAEYPTTNRAVNDTAGIILTYNNKPISAMYSSSAGGKTVAASDSFGYDVPYLQSVASYDDDYPKFGHGVGMTQHGARNLAKMGNNAYQILAHFYNNIQFAKLNPVYYK